MFLRIEHMLSFAKRNCEICTFTFEMKMRMIREYRKSILSFVMPKGVYHSKISIYDSEMIPRLHFDNSIRDTYIFTFL